MKERLIIDGTIYNADNLSETYIFRIKAKSNSQNKLNCVEVLTAPKKGSYILSRTIQRFLGENPTNSQPVPAKLYRHNNNRLLGTCSI